MNTYVEGEYPLSESSLATMRQCVLPISDNNTQQPTMTSSINNIECCPVKVNAKYYNALLGKQQHGYYQNKL